MLPNSARTPRTQRVQETRKEPIKTRALAPEVSLVGCPGLFRAKSRESRRGFPALWQHIEGQRVAVGVLIAFQYCHWRQHVPDATVVEDVALTRFAHCEAIQFVFVIVGYDHFATVSAAAAQQVRCDVLLPVFMQARRTGVARPARRRREPYEMDVDQILRAHRRQR